MTTTEMIWTNGEISCHSTTSTVAISNHNEYAVCYLFTPSRTLTAMAGQLASVLVCPHSRSDVDTFPEKTKNKQLCGVARARGYKFSVIF